MLSRDEVYQILVSKLKRVNPKWYQENILDGSVDNQCLCFEIADSENSYNRIFGSRGFECLKKLLKSIFEDTRLNRLNNLVFVGGYVFSKQDFENNKFEAINVWE